MPKKIASRRREPRATRPYMPGYGISTTKKSMLPWKWAEGRLRKSRQYWMITVRPDGRPHVMPVWGLWRDDGFYFSTGGRSRKARNWRNFASRLMAARSGWLVAHWHRLWRGLLCPGSVHRDGDAINELRRRPGQIT